METWQIDLETHSPALSNPASISSIGRTMKGDKADAQKKGGWFSVDGGDLGKAS